MEVFTFVLLILTAILIILISALIGIALSMLKIIQRAFGTVAKIFDIF